MFQDYFKKNNNFEKKYKVYLEKSNKNFDGYIYKNLKEMPFKSKNKNFILTFHFKKQDKKNNPLFIIDNIDGEDFSEKINIINHFKKNHALSYCVECDGLSELIKEEKK